ncbi:MAG: hypothetical protein FJY98_03655 [Candidatus Liptonbacteria bacterium]|nr:hypothetical protein [Candidatus Liptonbacteria bacterium]
MNSESRNCQSCKKQFTIESEDFDFYEKIKVPPPTWCPQCRMIRRMSWRNTWHLFKKQDLKTGEQIFSAFPPESPVSVYEKDFWYSDGWDPLEYGRDIDWKRPFMEQIYELMQAIPFPAHSVQSVVNSEYCTNASYIKNCYFARAVAKTEDSAYLIWDGGSKNCMDSHMTDACEFGYGNVNASRCYKTFFSVNCEDCQDVLFSKDCVGCSNCVGCVGLRSKSYCIFNVPYTKEEYAVKVKELNLGSWKAFQNLREQAEEQWLTFPVKFMHGLQNVNVSGDYIYNSKNAKHCWRVKGIEDSKFCLNLLSGPVKDCYDYSNWGAGSELIYEGLVCGDQTYNVRFSWNCFGGCKNVQYSIFCPASMDVFGCVSLRKKQYCILNKQYSKEEYESLVPKIMKHMTDVPYCDRMGRIYKYGEFFPSELSPFSYNITEAHEISPKTREQVKAEGLMWREEEKRNYTATIKAEQLPDRVEEASEEILKEVIGCAHGGECEEECTLAFRIVPQELAFLKRFNLPLPRMCPNCRHYGRLEKRNLPQFFRRQCQCAGAQSETKVYANSVRHSHGDSHCPVQFETSYAPERPEIVYCEACYQAEVV